MKMGRSNRPTQIERARQWIKRGAVTADDSDDELGIDDQPWEWIYADQDARRLKVSNQDVEDEKNSRKRKASAISSSGDIVGARIGKFECRLGDTVLLKAEGGNDAWVGVICDLFDGEDDGQKMANFMWFSDPREIRNKGKKMADVLDIELYITPSWDDNPLTTINGNAIVLSPKEFAKRYPKGTVPRSSKDFGKVFVCRRGCNTRTATYTDEFVWEDIYGGEGDLPNLIKLIQSQTKATRKKSGLTKKFDAALDDFIDRTDDDDSAPHTPRKKQKLKATTPTSKHKALSPRKFLTPTHKRIVVKKPLSFTPLGTRILSPHTLSSPYQLARSTLHVSSVPASLPCREDEFAEVYTHLEKAITDGTGSCIYIAGTPGTGKTATVREVIAQLNAAVVAEELDDFIFVEINGMKVTDPHHSYSLLWEAIRGERIAPAQAQTLLEREFSTPSPRRVPVVVLMDELDQLVTRNQAVMYNFFNWPAQRHSRLIVLAVANTMDLPERTLSNKISSRLGLHRITFRGYTHEQLIAIVASRLAGVPGSVVHPDAVQFAARKVAAVSGDARRALDICRRAVEIAEAESAAQAELDDKENGGPATPSKRGRGKAVADGPRRAEHVVTIQTVKQAITEATSSPLQQCLRGLPLASKVFLAALLALIRRTGVQEALIGDVIDEARRLALMSELSPVHEVLLGEMVGVEGSSRSKPQPAARVVAIEDAVMGLAEAGIVGVEARKGERARRVRLGVGDDEVNLALGSDEEVRGLGFNP